MRLLKCYLCFLGLTSLAVGDVIFSDFDPTNVTYQGGWGVYGTSNSEFPGAFNSMAMAFTPGSQVSLTRATNYLTHLSLVQFWSA